MNKQTQNTIWALEGELRSHKNEIARLKEELASVEKDAARYQWLRDAHNATNKMWNLLRLQELDTFDASIDAAMKVGAGETAPDLNTCPNCGGEADQGHDREYPPNPYLCSKCQSTTEDCSAVQTKG